MNKHLQLKLKLRKVLPKKRRKFNKPDIVQRFQNKHVSFGNAANDDLRFSGSVFVPEKSLPDKKLRVRRSSVLNSALLGRTFRSERSNFCERSIFSHRRTDGLFMQ
jgi:hypothetical protein